MGQNCSIEVPKTDKEEEKKKQIYTSPSVTRLKEEEEERKKQKVVQVKQDKWIKHYCSSHKILIVGEGDFYFSLCLVNSFDSASNIVATSLGSIGKLMRNYEKAVSNICELEKKGGKVIHGVDATTMVEHSLLHGQKFDRIVFNFPYVTAHHESREAQLTKNQKLVHLFFENAKRLINEEGEIHIVTNKSVGFFLEWNIVTLASLSGLPLVEEVAFNTADYPGYANKFGYGYKFDKSFNLGTSTRTYKFRLQRSLDCGRLAGISSYNRSSGKRASYGICGSEKENICKCHQLDSGRATNRW